MPVTGKSDGWTRIAWIKKNNSDGMPTMKRLLTTLSALLLIAAVSPLFAQQEDTPAAPAEDVPAQPAEDPPAEVPDTEEDAEDVEPMEIEDGEVELLEVRPAQLGVQRAVVVRGAVQLGGGRVGGGIARQFNDELAGLDELVLGAVSDGVTNDANPTAYRFVAEGPGLLTVAVRAKQGDDMTIEIFDANGVQLGRCDIDFGGDTGAEHLAVPIAEAGAYRVVVDPLGNGGPYWVGASWLMFEELEAMAPSRPDDALEITPNQAAQDITLAADGPAEQWLTYTAPAEGLLVFSTTAERGDLVLEAYMDGRFDNAYQYSDQDRGGNGARERLLLDLAEGQVIYIKARSLSSGRDIEFSARSQFIDTSE